MLSKKDRDAFVRFTATNPMHGLRGGRLWVSKNIARFQRESGEWLRFLMTALTGCAPGTEYNERHWELDALEVGGRWAGAVLPHPTNPRTKCL
eukprot:5633810-Alexandrium_andersonii.AAC.1